MDDKRFRSVTDAEVQAQAAQNPAVQTEVARPEFPPIGLPLHYELSQVQMAEGSLVVLLQITNPVGTFKFLLTADGTVQLAKELERIGKATVSGLTLPAGVHL